MQWSLVCQVKGLETSCDWNRVDTVKLLWRYDITPWVSCILSYAKWMPRNLRKVRALNSKCVRWSHAFLSRGIHPGPYCSIEEMYVLKFLSCEDQVGMSGIPYLRVSFQASFSLEKLQAGIWWCLCSSRIERRSIQGAIPKLQIWS